MKRFLLTLILIYCWPGIWSLNASDASNAADIAKLVKRSSRAPGGICAVINDPDHSLSVELSKRGHGVKKLSRKAIKNIFLNHTSGRQMKSSKYAQRLHGFSYA